MTYSLLYTLPKNHRTLQPTNQYASAPDKDVTMCLSEDMISSIYGCEVEGRRHTTKAVAAFDEDKGTFDVVLELKQEWRLRDIFNGRNAAMKSVLLQGIDAEQAKTALGNFEKTCVEGAFLLTRGPLSLPTHYSYLSQVRDDGATKLPRFASKQDALNSLKPK